MRRSNLSILLPLALAAAQDVPNRVVNLSSCQSLSCSPPNGSICSTTRNQELPIGVGIAPNAIEVASTSLSFTLINGLSEPGFTGLGSAQYEFSDQQLFVGLDPTLGEDDYPSGCVLMMQYLAQTFPLETFIDEYATRSEAYTNTTSCDGVIDTICQSSISDMIRDFDATESNNSSSADKCTLLTSHVNAKLQENDATCGGEGTWIANFMNVTGGALPAPTSSTDLDERLGSDDCEPVLPADYQLHKVAVMRQIYLSDPPSSNSEYYARIFAGQAGYTPVITVLYSGDDEMEISEGGVQFSCLQTYQPDGEALEDPFESSAVGLSGKINYASLLAMLLCGVLVLLV